MQVWVSTRAHAHTHTHLHMLLHSPLTFPTPHSVPSRRGISRRLQLLGSRGSVWQERAWHMS